MTDTARKLSPAKMAERIARFVPGGIPRWIHVYDNGGETADRYTVVFTGRYREKTGGSFWHVTMSGAPTHPQGVCMHGESEHTQIDSPTYGHLGKKISFHDLPEACRNIIVHDYSELWDLTESIVAQNVRNNLPPVVLQETYGEQYLVLPATEGGAVTYARKARWATAMYPSTIKARLAPFPELAHKSWNYVRATHIKNPVPHGNAGVEDKGAPENV